MIPLVAVVLFGSIFARAQFCSASEAVSSTAIDGNGNEATSNSPGLRPSTSMDPSDRFREGKPISVIVDGWWSRGYARAICERKIGAAPETELTFQRVRCAERDPTTAVLDFEDKLMNYLRVNAHCGNMIVARYNGPTETSVEMYRLMAAPHWSLALNFKPAALLQSWSLSSGNVKYSEGESETIERMAGDICTAILRADQDTPAIDYKARPNETASVRFLR